MKYGNILVTSVSDISGSLPPKFGPNGEYGRLASETLVETVNANLISMILSISGEQVSGSSGFSGFSGTNGTIGSNGVSGASGFSGFSGAVGASGNAYDAQVVLLETASGHTHSVRLTPSEFETVFGGIPVTKTSTSTGHTPTTSHGHW